MKRAQLIVCGIALLAGGTAYYLASGSPPPQAPAPVVRAAPTIATTEVLVIATDIPTGSTVGLNDMRWQPWPQDSTSPGMIQRAAEPDAQTQLAGSLARTNFFSGEPVRKDKLIRTDGSGFMSAILPAGQRAIAISIDTRGASTAGGFVLPNDRVDIIRTSRDEDATRAQGSDVFQAETILRNVRVLAIGQNVQEKDGQKVVLGETATLEVDPRQAETITYAQKIGQLSLALRSLADANRPDEPVARNDGFTVVRFGVSRQSAKQ